MSFKGILVGILVLALVGVGGFYGWKFKKQRAAEAAEAKLYQADAFRADEDYESAQRILHELIAELSALPRPKQAEALVMLAQVYEKQGKSEAVSIHERILADYPDTDAAASSLLHLARMKEEKSPKEAEQLYADLLSKRPDGAFAYAAQMGRNRILHRRGEIETVHANLLALLEKLGEPEDEQLNNVRLDAYDLLSQIHNVWLFSPEIDPLSENYVIQPGDVLEAIAKKYNTTAWYLMKVNGLRSAAIRPRMTIKVPQPGGVNIVVDKSDLRLYLFRNDGTFLKWYRCGVGRIDYKTKEGEYVIGTKEQNPTWVSPQDGRRYKPGDEGYALGEPGKTAYWMGLGLPTNPQARTGLGIHGTNEPETVGSKSSAGCIRLVHDDIAELFDLVPMYTKVTIRP
ncbi:L,D-transpeptidase family protein [bacterium]|nr:L,D-transpeptidase family protein [bacterium]